MQRLEFYGIENHELYNFPDGAMVKVKKGDLFYRAIDVQALAKRILEAREGLAYEVELLAELRAIVEQGLR